MSVKTSADVLIGGKVYTLSGYESEDYLQKVANYINGKISEFESIDRVKRFPLEMKSTLLALNIADDYYKAKERAEKLEEDIREKDKEIYDLKHELISAQIKEESRESAAGEMEKENRELLLEKARLEAALADALAGQGQMQSQGQTWSGEGDEGKDVQGIGEDGEKVQPGQAQSVQGRSVSKEGQSEWEYWVEEQKEEARRAFTPNGHTEQ